MEIRKAKVDEDLVCDVKAMERLIDSNTVCICVSGPEYPFGNWDDIEAIGAIAKKNNIGCHLD
jgi:sphinganine-1-phosphate aldolase